METDDLEVIAPDGANDLADLTALMSQVGRDHPDLAQDEKVRPYVLLLIDEARKAKALATCDDSALDI